MALSVRFEIKGRDRNRTVAHRHGSTPVDHVSELRDYASGRCSPRSYRYDRFDRKANVTSLEYCASPLVRSGVDVAISITSARSSNVGHAIRKRVERDHPTVWSTVAYAFVELHKNSSIGVMFPFK
jgi:hypothetical protein